MAGLLTILQSIHLHVSLEVRGLQTGAHVSDNEKVYLLQSCYYMQHFAWDARVVIKQGKYTEESAAPTFIAVCSLPAEDCRPAMHAMHSSFCY